MVSINKHFSTSGNCSKQFFPATPFVQVCPSASLSAWLYSSLQGFSNIIIYKRQWWSEQECSWGAVTTLQWSKTCMNITGHPKMYEVVGLSDKPKMYEAGRGLFCKFWRQRSVRSPGEVRKTERAKLTWYLRVTDEKCMQRGGDFFNRFPGIPGKNSDHVTSKCMEKGVYFSTWFQGDFRGMPGNNPRHPQARLEAYKPPMFYTVFSWGFLGNVNSDPLKMYKKKPVHPPKYTLIGAGDHPRIE